MKKQTKDLHFGQVSIKELGDFDQRQKNSQEEETTRQNRGLATSYT